MISGSLTVVTQVTDNGALSTDALFPISPWCVEKQRWVRVAWRCRRVPVALWISFIRNRILSSLSGSPLI